MPTTGRGSVGCGRSTVAACAGRTRARTTLDIIARSGLESSREPIDVKFVEPTAAAALSLAMTAMGTDFENSFRRFLAQPDTQEVVAEEQKKELAVMEKANELEKLEELQGQREQLAVALQDLDPETQRLVYPVLRLKMVQNILFAQLKESRKAGTSFTHAVRDRGLLRMLEKLRDELLHDPENAKRIEKEFNHNVACGVEHTEKQKPKKERLVLPATQMLPIIQSGVQLRANGNHKFKQGDYKRALEMYLQGCVGFEMYQATNAQDQGLLDEVHVQVRKNAAAAAIKTRDWTICIESCTKVLAVESADIKSYYRRACAQWHLGEVELATADLEALLKRQVDEYKDVAEVSAAKRAARALLRQIEDSEERAELIEQRMARALARPAADGATGGR